MGRLGPSRRAVLAGAGGAALPGLAFGRDRAGGSRLWYRQPAARWEEALPLGNGRLGAMVFGRVGQERLQLNEATLWAGSPYQPANPDALKTIPKVRALIAAGQYGEAAELASAGVMAKPLRQMSYGTLGDVLLTFVGAQAPSKYERELDLETAIATTRFHNGAGEVRREAFVSAVDQVVVLRLEAGGGTLDFDLEHRGPRSVKHIEANYSGAATLVTETEVDWLASEAVGARRPDIAIVADGEAALLITGRNEAGEMTPAGLTWALRLEALSDGRVAVEDGRLTVRGAKAVTLLLSAATSYVDYRDVSGDPALQVRRQGRAAAAKPYARLRADHIADHQALYGTVSLDLGRTAAAAAPTDARIAAAETADDPALAALYFQFARYLLIACSRPGGQPATLQGLWNEGIHPPWGSKYTININTEMNYWPADPAGLGVCVEPLLRMVEELAVSGAETARVMYGAGGWVAHHNTDLWRASAPIDGPQWGLWPCGGAWLCNSLWDHYDYGRDARVLQRLYPLMAGASRFFLETLIEDPGGRGLITSPSISPENHHPFGTSVCAGPAMDRQILRDLFDNTARAAVLLGRDEAFRQEVMAARARLAPDRIGKAGQLQEWLEDWDEAAPDQNHRHVSHLYAVYPSSQVNVRDTPALLQAAKTSLRKRGDLATGWGTAWRLCLWARMGEGDHAHGVLKALTGPQRTYPNMFDAHPPFQIDGNFGGAAGILEMLVQSWGGEVLLLPALPRAWPSGALKGVRARGGLTLDLAWRRGRLTSLEISGPAGAPVALRYRGGLEAVVLDGRGRWRRSYR